MAVKTAPLSVSTAAGVPQVVKASVKVSTTSSSGDGCAGDAGDEETGVVVDDVEDFDAAAVGEAPVGDVGLPALVGVGRLQSVSSWSGGVCGVVG